ncbi:MAG TPA: aminotransferase class I/II-fold pyridoxal phosphate-dependent enzyme, partial [Polyangia bacterium]|nr:aminotransferase class I/II-fold pyridoxal phosphate-dependent enzyme [Polyangia bacterium]
MPRESIFSLHDEALLRQRRGERIIDGTVGVLLDDAGRLAVLPTVAAALDELPPLSWAPYAPVAGEADFLNAVIEKAYPPELRASAIAVATPGATGAVSLAIATGLEPGEALLTRSLHFTAYVDLAAAQGRRLTTFSAFGGTGRFDVAALARRLATLAARQSHLLIVLNDPCQNPTGYTMSSADWEAVADVVGAVALHRPTTILIDAAYADFAPTAWNPPYGVLARLAESADVLTAWSASKSLTAYGLRVGALLALCPRAARRRELAATMARGCGGRWGNVNRGGMMMVGRVLADPALARAAFGERRVLSTLLKERAQAFRRAAERRGLMFHCHEGGFFATLPLR